MDDSVRKDALSELEVELCALRDALVRASQSLRDLQFDADVGRRQRAHLAAGEALSKLMNLR